MYDVLAAILRVLQAWISDGLLDEDVQECCGHHESGGCHSHGRTCRVSVPICDRNRILDCIDHCGSDRMLLLVLLFVVVALVALRRLLLLSGQQAISNLLVVNGLEVCGEHLQSLSLEDLAALDILCPVEVVIAHVEPLHLECWCRVSDVAFGQKL